jgi:hypothetical protein
MKPVSFQPSFYLSLLILFWVNNLNAQPWTFVKEQDGIKIYTRIENKSQLKSYKGEAVICAQMEKVCALLGTATNFDWWGEDFTKIAVLEHEDHKFIQYYFVYNMPWPVTDRDLVVESTIKMDTVTHIYTVTSKPLLKKIPETPELVRIRKYGQKWTVQPMSIAKVHVMIEGIVDLGGNVPPWIYNMLITQVPFNTISLLRDRAMSPKPANK